MSNTAVRLVEVGNLYVGDEVLLPGDVFGTVTGFSFFPDNPGLTTVTFDILPHGRVFDSIALVQVAA